MNKKDMKTLANKVIVITGASSGIGEAMAKVYAAQGAKVVLGARNVQEIVPVSGHHSERFEVTGFRIGTLAYLTDFKTIEDAEAEKLRGTEVLVVNALRFAPHPSHFNLAEALALIRRVGPREAYITHMSHEIGLHAETEATLPPGVHLAYDGLEVEI